jgi:hypothetical protein
MFGIEETTLVLSEFDITMQVYLIFRYDGGIVKAGLIKKHL